MFDSAAPVSLRFELTNVGKTDCYVLTWFTPLEGINSDCLSIKRNGKTKVSYDGPILKRGTPEARDFLIIRAGQTIAADVDVSESYDVSRPADYQVALNIKGLEHCPVAAPKGKIATQIGTSPTVEHRLVGKSIVFKVSKGAGRHLTRGQLARQVSKPEATSESPFGGAFPATAPPLTPRILGGTAAQRAQLSKAHRDGFNLCAMALNELAETERYREWFGTFSSRRFSKVKNTYSRIVQQMQSHRYVYDLRGARCPRGAFGYTFKNSKTIWLCGGFWNATAMGADSKAGTIIHEHSHCDARTEDLTFGQARARALAAKSPNKAVTNADNYEYYATG